MARNMQIFHQLREQATRRTIQDTTTKERKTPHAYTQRKEVQPNQVKTIIILISTYRSKHKHNAKSRGKKNRECLRQLYEAIIPI
jgi:cell envelope opacity-associated protein A